MPTHQIVNPDCAGQPRGLIEQGGFGDRPGYRHEGQGVSDPQNREAQPITCPEERLGQRRAVHLLSDGQPRYTDVTEPFREKSLFGGALGKDSPLVIKSSVVRSGFSCHGGAWPMPTLFGLFRVELSRSR
jgi:hypothetical protein